MSAEDKKWVDTALRISSGSSKARAGPVQVVSREVVERVRFHLRQTRGSFEQVVRSAESEDPSELDAQIQGLGEHLHRLAGLLGGVLEALVEETPDEKPVVATGRLARAGTLSHHRRHANVARRRPR